MLSLIVSNPNHWVIGTVRTQQLRHWVYLMSKCRLCEFLHDSFSWYIKVLTGGKGDWYRTLCVASDRFSSPFSTSLMLLKDNCRMRSQWARSKAVPTFSVPKAESVSLPYTELSVWRSPKVLSVALMLPFKNGKLAFPCRKKRSSACHLSCCSFRCNNFLTFLVSVTRKLSHLNCACANFENASINRQKKKSTKYLKSVGTQGIKTEPNKWFLVSRILSKIVWLSFE